MTKVIRCGAFRLRLKTCKNYTADRCFCCYFLPHRIKIHRTLVAVAAVAALSLLLLVLASDSTLAELVAFRSTRWKSTLDRLAALHLPTNLTRLCNSLTRLGPKPKLDRAGLALLSSAANHSHQPRKLDDSDYLRIDCPTLLRSYVVESDVLSAEESSFPIAFSILMYKDVWQFERLLRAIYRPHNFYCVHVDAKASDATFKAVRHIQTCLAFSNPNANVVVAADRVAVHWASVTQVDAELSCMRELVGRSGTWKYLINLTGQEFPLKTMWQLVRILGALNGSNSMEATVRNINSDRRLQLEPFANKHNITAVKGATHLVVVRRFVEFLFESPVSRDLLQHLRDAPFADETYFATLNHNPRLGAPGGYLGEPETDADTYPFINRLKNWGELPCHGFRLRAVCVWGVGDLGLLTDDRRKELFVNKLVWDFQHYALDCLEEWYWDKTLSELRSHWEAKRVEYNVDYYRNLSMTRNHL